MKQLNLKNFPKLKKLEDIFNYYHNYIRIENIRSSNNTQSQLFTFNLIFSDEMKRELLILNHKKASSEGDIPVNILKDDIDIYVPTLTEVKSRTEMSLNWLIYSLFTKSTLLIKKIIGL